VSTPLVDEIAEHIRRVDASNQLAPTELGWEIVLWMKPVFGADLVGFVERTNPDKRMGAGRLAELIVAEFNLDEEG
jgi:hypothetical protein